jgi:hypothetical protein
MLTGFYEVIHGTHYCHYWNTAPRFTGGAPGQCVYPGQSQYLRHTEWDAEISLNYSLSFVEDIVTFFNVVNLSQVMQNTVNPEHGKDIQMHCHVVL